MTQATDVAMFFLGEVALLSLFAILFAVLEPWFTVQTLVIYIAVVLAVGVWYVTRFSRLARAGDAT